MAESQEEEFKPLAISSPVDVRGLALTLLAVVAAIWVLYVGRSLFVPILIGLGVLTGGASLTITGLEGMLLTPMLMSRTASMNAVAMFIGILCWGWLWGFWGMLLAVPLLMVLKVIADHVEDLAVLGELLGD